MENEVRRQCDLVAIRQVTRGTQPREICGGALQILSGIPLLSGQGSRLTISMVSTVKLSFIVTTNDLSLAAAITLVKATILLAPAYALMRKDMTSITRVFGFSSPGSITCMVSVPALFPISCVENLILEQNTNKTNCFAVIQCGGKVAITIPSFSSSLE